MQGHVKFNYISLKLYEDTYNLGTSPSSYAKTPKVQVHLFADIAIAIAIVKPSLCSRSEDTFNSGTSPCSYAWTRRENQAETHLFSFSHRLRSEAESSERNGFQTKDRRGRKGDESCGGEDGGGSCGGDGEGGGSRCDSEGEGRGGKYGSEGVGGEGGGGRCGSDGRWSSEGGRYGDGPVGIAGDLGF